MRFSISRTTAAILRGSLAAIAFWAGLSVSAVGAETAKPVLLPVIKQEYPGKPKNIRLVHVPLMKLGDKEIGQPLLLDTGSSGMSIDCEFVLPKEMCSLDGIKIDQETSINGIVVTTQKVEAHYGGSIHYGHLARAKVWLGDETASVSTEQPISFMIRTKVVRRSDGQVVGGKLWPKGMLGISPIGRVDVKGEITSPLNAVAVPEGLHKGYSIGDLGSDWAVCATEDHNCPSVPALAIGVDPKDREGWKFTLIKAAEERFNFPTVSACIVIGEEKPNCLPTLFDTGNSMIYVGGVEAKPLKNGKAVKVATLAEWAFKTRYVPEVAFEKGLPHHVIGLRFFEENRLSIDLSVGLLGLRIVSGE
ncbi:hypothetical protein ACSBLW_10005 [Thioclava sp. FR2]|uniref:hypothetical protein n=1 Tax=Thioclava sp. FR2 TaxID=3445780 RepID=UPI003EBA3B34